MDIRRTAIIAGVAVLFALFIGFAIDAFYEAPKWENFCKNSYYNGPYAEPIAKGDGTVAGCLNSTYASSKENMECADKKGMIVYEWDNKGCPTSFRCDFCQKEFDDKNERYNRNVFIISAIIGIIAIIFGIWLPAEKNPVNEIVGSGLMFGGIITVFYGTVRYFGNMGKYMRVAVLFVELIMLIYIAYKKLNTRKAKKKKK